MTIYRNPVSYSVYFGLFLFLALPVLLGVGFSDLLPIWHHVLLPYTVDVDFDKVDGPEALLRLFYMFLQGMIVYFALKTSKAVTNSKKIAFSVLGILFVVMYFSVIFYSYVAANFH